MTSGLIHGDSYTRLYDCWLNMKYRSSRDGVSICEDWQSWYGFKKWANTHGYEDDLVLRCRNRSETYGPDNCFWDLKSNNSVESNAKNYWVTDPGGNGFRVYNLTAFAKSNKLDNSGLSKVAVGKRKHYKGYKVEHYEKQITSSR